MRLRNFTIFLFALISHTIVAHANTPEPSTIKQYCAQLGGQWFGEDKNYWSCCWSDWGCLQCEPSGHCEMVCSTDACTEANDQNSNEPQKAEHIKAKGLVPEGMQEPVIPKTNKPFKKIPLMKPGTVKQTL